MHEVLFPCFAVDQDIVKEDQDKLPETRSKSCVHGILEGPRGSGEAEGHNPKFKLTKVCLEGSFEFVPRFHADLVKAGL